MTLTELQAERDRLASIGAGWHALDDTPAPDPKPTRKPAKAAKRDASVAEQRRAFYSGRPLERSAGTRGPEQRG